MSFADYVRKRKSGEISASEKEEKKPVETAGSDTGFAEYVKKRRSGEIPAPVQEPAETGIQFDRNQAMRRRQTNNPFQTAVESYNAGKVDLSKLKYRDGLNMNQTIGNAKGTFTPSTPEPANLTREGQWAAKHPYAGLGMYAVTNYIGGGEGAVNMLDAARREAMGQGKIGANEINAAPLAQAYRTGASEGIRRYVANSNENLPRVIRTVGNIDSNDGVYSSSEQALDFLTGVGADAASSSLNMAMGGNLSTYLMGANAAGQSLYDTANDEKTTSGQALALAAANGIAEAFFEKFSVENAGAVQKMFRNNPVSIKDFARTLLVSAGVEGSEEMNTEIANILSDIFIRGENSESGRMYANAVRNGADPNAAAAEVLRANLKQIGMAGLGGALSGGLHTGLYSSVGTMQRGMDLHNVTSAADIMDTIDTSTKEGQTAYDIASQIAEKEASGKRATAIDYGRLQNAVDNAVEAASEAAPSTEKSVPTTENAAPSIEEAVPSTDDVEIREVPRGDFRSSDAIRQTAENVRAQMDADYQEAFNEMYGADTEGIKGRGGNVEGSKENKKSYHIPVETLMRIDEDNRQNKTYSGLGRYGQETFEAQSFGSDAYDSATSLYNSIRFGQDLTEAEKMRNARLLTDDQVFNISQAAFKDLNSFYNWDRAGKISAMAEKHTLKDVTPGKVTYADGIDIDAIRADGSKEARQKVAQMAYAEGLLSKVFGYNVHWIQSGIDDNTGRYVGENGSYDPSTHTISLDINAGANYVGDAVKYGTVISHELTHTLELGAVEQYKKIADSVMNILVNDEEYSRGRNAQQIIADMIENNPHVHNEAEAVHELVAQACEDMLNGNRDIQEMLAGLDEAEQKSFFDRISDIFNSILQFIEDMLSSDAVKSDRREAEALRRAKEEIEGLRDTWNEGVKNAAVATKFAGDIGSEKAEHSTRDDTQDKINHSMTMEQAKRMIQAAFAANDIKEWYDGKFKNGDEWAREAGSEEVALYIENTYELQEKYINANEDINNDEYMIEDVIDAYLNGTLVGKEKPKPKRIDVSKEVAYEDSRFYAPHNEAVAREVYDLANRRVTKSNQADVYRARTKILFAAHGGNLAETLGISESELNKKLRTWSRYSGKTRDLADRLNRGVAAQNRWAGLQNCSILSNSSVTDADIESMVKSVEGTSRGYERSYIGKTLLAIDTHMDWSWLGFNFKQGRADESRASVRGYYFKNMVTIGGSSGENTVAHEMGHAMDHKWFCDIFGEDVEKSDDELTRTARREDLIKDPDARQFYRNFRIFIDNLTDSNDLRSSYTMAKNETFARFVAKFVEWTNKTAGNYFYAEPYGYNDRFTTSQYLEFVRLLQEKAAIDTKKANNSQYSSREYKYDQNIERAGMSVSYQVSEDGERIAVSPESYMNDVTWKKIHNAINRLGYEMPSVEDTKKYVLRGNNLNPDQTKAVQKVLGISSADEKTQDINRAKEIAKKAARHFGTTNSFNKAAYLTVNGSMLDFSEGQSYRTMDHRSISEVLELPEDAGYSDGMIEFMNEGNIRLQTYGAEIVRNPNKEQRKVLRRQIESLDGEFTLDVSNENGYNIFSMEYPEGTRPARIFADIDRYFEDGTIPGQDSIGMFHTQYSSREDIEAAADDPNNTSVIRMGSEQDIKYSTRFARGINDRLRVHMGTFFAGTGTVDFALRNIVSHQFAVEYDAKIAALYKLNNNGGTVYADDVRNVKVDPYKGRVEYFHASPVCKSYSGANNDSGEKPLDIETARATARAIEELNPKVVTIENVARYRNSNAIKIIEEALTKNGYTFDKGVYKATDFGGATIRERMFIRAVKDGVLPDINEYKEAPKSWYSVVEDLIDKLPEEPLSNYMKERLEVSGIDIDNLTQPVLVLGGNKGEKLTYAYADKPSPTIIANSTESRILMPDGRVLRAVPRVLARIQGLPDDFDLGLKDDFNMEKSRGGVTRAYTVVGNGVTTQLTEGVFEPLLKANIIDRKSQETGISYSTRDNTINGYTPSSIGSLEELMRYNSGIRDMSAGLAAALEEKGAQGAKLSDAQIERIARKFIKQYGSEVDPKKITGGLKSMFDYIDMTSKVSASQLGKIAHDYAREILDKATQENRFGDQYPDLKKGFKTANLKLTDELKGDIINTYESVPNFKRKMRGILDISEKGTQGVDTYYEELKGLHPDLFTDDIINPADQLIKIAQVAELLNQKRVKADYGSDIDEFAYVVGQEMVAQYFAEKGDSRYKREVDAIKAEMTKKHQAEMAELRADAAKEYQKLKDRLGSKAMKVAEVRAELNAMHRRVMERRELRLLTREAKKRLMEQARKLRTIKGSREFESAKRELIGNLDLVSYGMSDGTRVNLEKLRHDALAQAAKDEDYTQTVEYADIMKLTERLDKEKISEMSLEEILMLTKSVLALKNAQQSYNRMLKEELGDYVAVYGRRLVAQQKNISGIRGKSHMLNALKRYALYMENPTRVAHLLDGYQQGGVFTELFDDINAGAIKAEEFKQKADEMFRPVLEDKELNRTWSKQNIPIEVNGQTYHISKGMRISMYLHSLNTDNKTHIKNGGFNIPDEKLYRQGRYTEAYAAGTQVPMDEATLIRIANEMTPAERRFAEVAKKFFNETTKEAINEVSLQLKGYELAAVDKYFPIRTDPNFTQKEIDGLIHDASIEGAGQFKDRQPGSKNPILLEDVAQVIQRQTHTTAQYYGLAIPVRNANKVWKYTSTAYRNSAKDAVAKNWLTDGAKIFENVLKDIQAGARRGDTGSHLFSLAKGAYAAAVLTANVGVSIKQSASYPLAIHMLDAASLAKGIVGKVDREYMDSITPLSWARRHGMGGQVEVADVFRQKGMIDDNPMLQKMKDLTNWIQAVDVATTDHLFVACEEYVKAHNPGLEVRGDEYNKMVADLYNDVLQRTQPSYGVMQRNELMRSSDAIMKALTMFKTQTFNMGGELLDAGLRVNALSEMQKKGWVTKEEVNGAKRNMANVVGATIMSQAMLAILATMANALLHKMKPYRDEEGNVTFESVAAKTSRDFGSSFFGLFFGLDVASQMATAVTGGKWYDVTAPQLDGINEAISATSKWSEALSRYMNGSGTKADLIKQSGNMAIKISGAFGIPANNVYNIANAVNLWVQDVQTDKVGTFESGYGILGITDTSLTAKQYKDRLYRAVDQYGYGTKEYEKAMDELKRKTGKEEKELFSSPYDDLYQVYREHGENSQEFKNRVKFLEEVGKKPKDIAKALNNRGATVTIK